MALAARSKRTIWLILCVILCIPLMTMAVLVDMLGEVPFTLLGMEISRSSFNGVLTACITLLCVVIVSIDHTRGTGLSIGVLGIQLLLMCRPIIMRHNYDPLPGMIHNLIIMVVMLILNRQFESRRQESVTDYLTGLTNRRGLMQRLEDEWNGRPYYVLFLDLRDFKFINDTFGHRVGNQVLKVVSGRMQALVGKKGFVSRVGGDEFVLIVPKTDRIEDLVQELLRILGQRITVMSATEEVECRVGANIGIAACPQDSSDPDVLLKYADMAMYQARERHSKNGYHFFSKALEAAMRRRAELEEAMSKGLENGWFYLVYQPQYYAEDKRLRGFETLLRLTDGDGNAISPGEFIPVAEKSDLIMSIDEYVLRRAMQEFCEAVQAGEEPLTISVNVSAQNLCRGGFAGMVEDLLEETGFPCQCLEIEITEYCLMQTFDIAESNIRRLKERGVKVALDDFGTGYASLAYLTQLSIDLLKIDKSFIDTITEKQSRSFVEAVISIGHINGCAVISEGVEDPAQLEILRECGCDFVQGYLWSAPLEYMDAVTLAACG